jgi:iron complex transport system ATP-binding protein
MTIALTQVAVVYGSHAVLQHIDLQARPGHVVGIVGPNGSGKSTLVKAIAGHVPSTGAITFHGEGIRPTQLGYMPQESLTPMVLTVLEVVLLGRLAQLGLQVREDDLQAVAQTLEQLGIAHLAGQRMGELSGGQRQLAYLAQALVSQPKYLLLDEPTSALDICHQLEVLNLVRRLTKERGLITLVVLHDLNAAARYCDEVALMHQGRLLLCLPPAAALTVEHVSRVFDVEAEALTCSDGVSVLVASHRNVKSRKWGSPNFR